MHALRPAAPLFVKLGGQDQGRRRGGLRSSAGPSSRAFRQAFWAVAAKASAHGFPDEPGHAPPNGECPPDADGLDQLGHDLFVGVGGDNCLLGELVAAGAPTGLLLGVGERQGGLRGLRN
jgi:hypothetical protein